MRRPSFLAARCLPTCLVWLLLGLAAAAAQVRPWQEYRTIMWIGDTAYRQPEKLGLFFQRLHEMGINTAMVSDDSDPKAVWSSGMPYYLENMVNRGLCLKWNSTVRDWDKFVTDWSKNGRPDSALVRDYCLDDPAWLDSARKQVLQLVRKHEAHQPVAYNLRDELSVTISANPFDYDFNPLTLAQFRQWLKTQYPGGLDALNAAWETRFSSWDEVKPFTTDQIKNRMASGQAKPQGHPDWQALEHLRFDPETAAQNPTRWNFSPWADFRTYMDISLARTLAELRRSAHAVDPQTPVGIEGTQTPSAFGGYDLWRLAQALDWVEPYDIGNAREIFGSFMPGRPVLTTVFETATRPAQRRLWHLLLEGDRGCIVWWSEDCIDWKSADYKLTHKAQALAPVLKEMQSPLAQLFLRAQPERDPVYIHYSQPSIQVDWLLESTVDGSTWLRRFSSFEGTHNRQARVRDGWVKALQDLGFTPQFISSEQIEGGALDNVDNAVLVLPNSWALSAEEATKIQAFLAATARSNVVRRVFCEGPPGWFDQHGRFRSAGAFPGLVRAENFAGAACVALSSDRPLTESRTGAANYPADRVKSASGSDWSNWLSHLLEPLLREVVVPTVARARIHRYQVARGKLVAIERNLDYHMSEDLKPDPGQPALENPITTEMTLVKPAHVYDLRTGRYLGQGTRFTFTLDPWQPSLFALLQQPLPPESVLSTLLADQEQQGRR